MILSIAHFSSLPLRFLPHTKYCIQNLEQTLRSRPAVSSYASFSSLPPFCTILSPLNCCLLYSLEHIWNETKKNRFMTTSLIMESPSTGTVSGLAACAGRRRSSSSSQGRQRRSSVSESRDSFAEYNTAQIDLSRLAIQSLKQYWLDDLSDDDDDSVSSFEYGSDVDEGEEVGNSDDKDEENCVSGQKPAQPMHNGVLSSTTALPLARPKKLCFGDVTIREYAVTVGALSATNDHCPLQLSWEHGPDKHMPLPSSSFSSCHSPSPSSTPTRQTARRIFISSAIEQHFHEDHSLPFDAPSSPRRLTARERMKRIATVQGIEEEDVEQLGISNVLSHIKEAMTLANAKFSNTKP